MRKTHRFAVGDKVVVQYYGGGGASYWHETTVKRLAAGVLWRGNTPIEEYPAYVVDVPSHYGKDLQETTVLDLKSNIRTVEEHEALRQARVQRGQARYNAKGDAEQQRRDARRLEAANAVMRAIAIHVRFAASVDATAIIAEALKGYV